MIYFLYGDDSDKARAKAHSIISSLLTKKPEASNFKIDGENWDLAALESYITGAGLFAASYIVLLDHVLENKDAGEGFVSKLKDMEASPNVFIVLEGKLTKAISDKVSKRAAKSQEFTKSAAALKREFNNFALSDALGRRDKKELWSLYQESVFEEKVPEGIHGVLFWQVKSMLLAISSKSAQDAGIKPFVYSKALRFADNYGDAKLRQMSADLVSIYHDSRKGGDELDVALERWILNI